MRTACGRTVQRRQSRRMDQGRGRDTVGLAGSQRARYLTPMSRPRMNEIKVQDKDNDDTSVEAC